MENAIKLSTLKSSMTTATVDFSTSLADEDIQKIRDALVAHIGEVGEHELVRLDVLFEGEQTYDYIAHEILQYACNRVAEVVSAFFVVANPCKYDLNYENIAYRACKKFAEGVPYARVRETENGIYEYEV